MGLNIMSDQDKMTLAANILQRAKALAPDRVPKPSQETAIAWATALSDLFDALPPQIWPEVVTLWSNELITDRMMTTKELRRAARLTRDRWEARPETRAILQAQREQRQELRDQQIANGTFAAIRGHKPRAVESVNPKINETINSLRSLWKADD